MVDTPIFEKKNVIVTGGAGFIGSHLCERLIQEAKVICIDDLSHGSVRNIEHLLQYPDFEFIRFDSNRPFDPNNFEELDKFRVKFQGIQEMYHLACPTSPKNFTSLKLHSLWANSASMVNTLDLAVKYKAKYVFTSSSVVYGEPETTDFLFNEGHEGIVHHISPRACYDEGKRFAETCVDTYKQVYNIDAKIARVFTTYGPRMKLRDGLMIPDFILQALDGKPIEIHGDKNMVQSLCYISDMIDGLVRLMKSGPETSVVNLGSDQMVNIVDVAQQIISLTKSDSEITFLEPLPFLTNKGIPDLRRAKSTLSWLPLVLLPDGLKRVVDYAVSNKELFQLE